MIFLGHLSTAAFKLARAPNLIRWMSSTSKAHRWKGRTFDLVGACRQCPARPTSKPYAHIVVQHPVSHQLFAFSSLLELYDRSIHFYGPHLACGISWSGILGPFRELFRMITLLLRQKRRQVQLRRAFTCFSDWLVETSLRLGRRPQPFLICFKLWALCSMSVPCMKDWLQLETQRAGILSWCRPC